MSLPIWYAVKYITERDLRLFSILPLVSEGVSVKLVIDKWIYNPVIGDEN